MKKVMQVSGIIGPNQYRLKDGVGREQTVFYSGKLKIGESVILVNGVIVDKTKTVAHTVYEV